MTPLSGGTEGKAATGRKDVKKAGVKRLRAWHAKATRCPKAGEEKAEEGNSLILLKKLIVGRFKSVCRGLIEIIRVNAGGRPARLSSPWGRKRAL